LFLVGEKRTVSFGNKERLQRCRQVFPRGYQACLLKLSLLSQGVRMPVFAGALANRKTYSQPGSINFLILLALIFSKKISRMIATFTAATPPIQTKKNRLAYEDYARLTPPDSGNYEIHDGQIIHMRIIRI
jgi:hypothetical protein